MKAGHCTPQAQPLLEQAGRVPGRGVQLTMEARMGRKSVVVATLLVHSVKVATRRERRKAVAGGGTFWSGVSWSPSQLDRPDFWGQEGGVRRQGCLGCPLALCWGSGRVLLLPHPQGLQSERRL